MYMVHIDELILSIGAPASAGREASTARQLDERLVLPGSWTRG